MDRSGDVRIEIKGAGLKVVKEDELLKHRRWASPRLENRQAGCPVHLEKTKPADPGTNSPSAIEPETKAAHLFRFAGRTEDLEKKLEEIREQLRQVKEKKLAIEDVEKSLEALTESVKKQEEGLRFAKSYARRLDAWTAKEPVAARSYARSNKDGPAFVITSSEKDDGLSLVLTTHPGKNGKERYDQTVAEIKQALPEALSLESELKEDSGAIVLTIKGPKLDRDKTDALLEKLIPILKKGGKEEPQAAK